MTIDKIENFTVGVKDLKESKANKHASFPHVAALNPSGAALAYIKELDLEIVVKTIAATKYSTAHFAAVCRTDENLKFLVA